MSQSSPTVDGTSGQDAHAFERLFTAHFDSLCRFVYSYVKSWDTAQEVVDDVFLQYWLRLREGEPIRDVKAYLFTTARNHAVNHLRREQVETRHRELHLQGEIAATNSAVAPAAERELARRELAATLHRALDTLPPRQREILLLKWERQETHEEIGQLLGIAPTTVGEHLRRALEHLRAILPAAARDFR